MKAHVKARVDAQRRIDRIWADGLPEWQEREIPTGPKGQKRPADVIGNAVKIARIATGEDTDETPDDGKDKALRSWAGRAARLGRIA